jgi:Lon-like ATP-dependent protease
VAWYPEVFDLVFPNIDKEQANKCKICEWKAQQKKSDAEPAEEED